MIYNKGKLIVLEGGDGSGKATQARLLKNNLESCGVVSAFEFPRYKQSTFGELIGKSLAGEFGDFLHLSPYLASLPYVLDRARAKYLLLESLKDGNVVCDRYTPSNLAFQAAKLPKKEREKFINFIEKAEYEELGLPAPDLVIYLEVPVEVSANLILKKQQRSYLSVNRKKDQHEKDVGYQKEVVGVYHQLAKKRKNWHIVKCVEKGKLLPIERIQMKIINIIKKELNLSK